MGNEIITFGDLKLKTVNLTALKILFFRKCRH